MEITGDHKTGTLVIKLSPEDSAIVVDENRKVAIFGSEAMKRKVAQIKTFLPAMGLHID